MAAPTPTHAGTPTGTMLEDGFRSLMTFASAPNVNLWERAVQPPGLDGGPAIDVMTMHNTLWSPMAPRKLLKLTEATFKAAYDPQCLASIVTLINKKDTITKHFPDGSTWCFFGYLREFKPGENTEGGFPEATCTVTPTNRDSSGAEQGPVYTAAAGS